MKILTNVPKQFMFNNKIYSSNKNLCNKTLLIDNKYVFNSDYSDEIKEDFIGMNMLQRNLIMKQLDQEVICDIITDYITDIDGLIIKIHFLQTPTEIKLTGEVLEKIIKNEFNRFVLQIGQSYSIKVKKENNEKVILKLEIIELKSQLQSELQYGILSEKTSIVFIKDSPLIKLTDYTENISKKLMNINFEQLGIGGLDEEFSQIFRRAFASRTFPEDIIQKLGINHVRGLMLYGPPGCGKTLIARRISKLLQDEVEPKIVNGPEILSKYVGESEKNLRELFSDAENNPDKLHIIIMDEIDAITKIRGNDNLGVHDSIVNQLLSKIDGVNSLNNILLIGMTNRIDIIDPALLRPGRFEIHIEIGLPNEEGRLQILKIHTNNIKKEDYLSDDVNISELAIKTKNFTGAEIEGLVRNTVSYAFQRNINEKFLGQTDTKIVINNSDFINSLNECKPMFGNNHNDSIKTYFSKGIVPFHNINEELTTLSNKDINLITILLSGEIGSGKSALSSKFLINSNIPFSRFISPDLFIGLSEQTKCSRIIKIFEEAYKSENSLIIIDDIERIIEFSKAGFRYSNTILQTLMILLKKPPPNNRKITIIATTSIEHLLKELDLQQIFGFTIEIPLVNNIEEVLKFYNKTLNEEIKEPIPIKKLINLIFN